MAASLTVVPPGAAASTAQVKTGEYGSEVSYRAGPGEANDLVVTSRGDGRRIVFADAGATIEPGRRCQALGDGNGVVCRPRKPRLPNFIEEAIEEGLVPEEVLGELAVPLELSVNTAEGDDSVDASALEHARIGGTRVELYGFFRLGDGADAATTGAAEDVVVPGPGDDEVDAGAGVDAVSASRGIDGADSLDGGPDLDYLDYGDRASPVTLDLSGADPSGRPGEGDVVTGFEAAYGGEGDDVLVGGVAADRLYGFAGDDELFGAEGADVLSDQGDRRGADVLHGGPGPDRLTGGGGSDQLLAGGGSDRVRTSGGVYFLFEDDARDTVRCGSGRDSARVRRRDRVHDCETVSRTRPGRGFGFEEGSTIFREPTIRPDSS
jgi:Ca2+-binding RTX toxin-like protein